MKYIYAIILSLIFISCGSKSHTKGEYELLQQEVTQLEQECLEYESSINYPYVTESEVLTLQENISSIKSSLENDERQFESYASDIASEEFFMTSNTVITDNDIKDVIRRVEQIGFYLASCSDNFESDFE